MSFSAGEPGIAQKENSSDKASPASPGSRQGRFLAPKQRTQARLWGVIRSGRYKPGRRSPNILLEFCCGG